MRIISTVHFFKDITNDAIINAIPFRDISIYLDDKGDSYIAKGNNTGDIEFDSKTDLIEWLKSLGSIKEIENHDELLDRLPLSMVSVH